MTANVIADLSGLSGYALLIVAGIGIWVGVPIANTVFGTDIMVDIITVFNGYPIYVYRGLGGGLAGFGLLSYAEFRLN